MMLGGVSAGTANGFWHELSEADHGCPIEQGKTGAYRANCTSKNESVLLCVHFWTRLFLLSLREWQSRSHRMLAAAKKHRVRREEIARIARFPAHARDDFRCLTVACLVVILVLPATLFMRVRNSAPALLPRAVTHGRGAHSR